MKIKSVISILIVNISMAYAQVSEVLPPAYKSLSTIDNYLSSQGLFTGTPDISIPLYTIDAGDFKLPITLNYNSKGLVVSQDDSPEIGHGWNLTTGGLVTRIVKKLPDDAKTVHRTLLDLNYSHFYNEDQEFTNVGFIHNGGSRSEAMYNSNYSAWQWNGSNEYLEYLYQAGHNALDTEPDEFYVSAPGLNASIYFNKNGKAFAVNAPGLRIRTTQNSNGEIIRFEITDSDGTQYNFNSVCRTYSLSMAFSTWDYMNFNFLYDTDVFVDKIISYGDPIPGIRDYYSPNEIRYMGGLNYISTWLLTSIKTKNNNIIEFDYLPKRPSQTSSYSMDIRNRYSGGWNDIRGERPVAGYVNTQIASLKSIKWKGGKTTFSYDSNYLIKYFTVNHNMGNGVFGWEFTHSLFATETMPNYPILDLTVTGLNDANYRNWYKLEKVNRFVASNETEILSEEPYRYTILQGYEKEEVEYKFNYNEQNMFPNRLSSEKDFWGFYNNNGATGIRGLIPTIYDVSGTFPLKTAHSVYSIFNDKNSTYPVLYQGSNRNSSEVYMKTGILEKIHYPTGGYTQFEFESHDFKYDDMLIAGAGLRIASMTDHPVNGPPVRRTFSYLNPVTGQTSGKIVGLPVFAHVPYYEKKLINSSSINEIQNIRGSFVGYSHVRVNLEGSGSTTYFYDIPGAFDENTHGCTSSGCLFEFPQTKLFQDGSYPKILSPFCYYYFADKSFTDIDMLSPAPNYSWNRGQKLRQIDRDESGNLVSEKLFEYETVIHTQIPYIISKNRSYLPLKCTGEAQTAMFQFITSKAKILITSKRPIKTTDIIYSTSLDGSKIEVKKEYSYNSYNQITEEKTQQSTGEWLITKYKYPSDYLPGGPSPFDSDEVVELLVKNINSFPLETTEYIQKGSTQLLTNAKYKRYKLVNNIPVLNKTYSLRTANPISDFASSYSSGPGALIKDPRYTEDLSYTRYNNDGNPLEIVSSTDGISTAYVYGFKGIHPVATVQNATYSQVEALLTTTDINYLRNGIVTYPLGPLHPPLYEHNASEVRLIINKLRTGLPNAQVHTYTYNDQGTINSKTSPAGITTSYEYDSMGRLQTIKDHDGNIVEMLEYFYKGHD